MAPRDPDPPSSNAPRHATPRAIVDAHHHLWKINGHIRYPWLKADYDPEHFILGDYKAICRDFDADAFIKATQGAPIVASIHVETECARDDALAETHWLHEVASHQASIDHDKKVNARTALGNGLIVPAAVVAWVDLLADDADERLAEQLAYPLVRGIRFKPRTAASSHTHADGPGTLSDPRWPRALDALAKHGLSWDLRVPFWHLEQAAHQLADASPVDVVLEHAGLPWDRSQAGLTHWRRGMEVLARNPHVSVKLSEFGLRDARWDDVENRRIIREAISIFGPHRCMFASNFPVASLRVSYSQLVALLQTALEELELDDDACRAIWHDNAVRIYRLACANVP